MNMLEAQNTLVSMLNPTVLTWPQNPETENGFTQLKPSAATEKHLHTWGNREHVMNAVVTRHHELLSRSGSPVRAIALCRWGGEGEDPLAILFFSREKRDVSRGIFFDVICVQIVSQYHLLFIHKN